MLPPRDGLLGLVLHPVAVQPQVEVLLVPGGGVRGGPPLLVVATDGDREVLGLREWLHAKG